MRLWFLLRCLCAGKLFYRMERFEDWLCLKEFKSWSMGTVVYRYPVLGPGRELKWVLERYWRGAIDYEAFREGVLQWLERRTRHLAQYRIDWISATDFFLYDFVLELALSLGIVPKRFLQQTFAHPEDLYFAVARGMHQTPPVDMTKWFNTNYHYLVPELHLGWTEGFPFIVEWARRTSPVLGGRAIGTIVGPLTFLTLSRVYEGKEEGVSFWRSSLAFREAFLREFLARYRRLLTDLAPFVQLFVLEEPVLVLEEVRALEKAYRQVYRQLLGDWSGPPVYVMVYYEVPALSPDWFEQLPIAGWGMDVSSFGGADDSGALVSYLSGFRAGEKGFLAGVVSGRHPFRTDPMRVKRIYERFLDAAIAPEKILWTHSAPLIHLPHTVRNESRIPEEIVSLLAFADERLEELTRVPRWAREGGSLSGQEVEHQVRQEVRERVAQLLEGRVQRSVSFRERYRLQRQRLRLPLLPTTTIGSFPQTSDVRRMRARWRRGEVSDAEYRRFIQEKIRECIRIQEELGLDVLVHGEFERADMVEYFAERLEGMLVTDQGWVQSYGSRAVRPPIIWGDIAWSSPMTVREIAFAQSLTKKPVKGMLTGPVTILQWSFVWEGLSREMIAYQLAVALRREIEVLLQEGISVIQIDEPAFREALPLKRSEWSSYKEWAVRAFRLTHSFVPPTVQIHTHMCYSEFGDIADGVYAMDADVLLIEASRSRGAIIDAFRDYPNALGPGVYDIHSPRIPTYEEIEEVLSRALSVFPVDRLWVNPDCGLKTRQWEEVIPSLRNMVHVAGKWRMRYATPV